jgi:hypothetical protein
VKGNGGIDFKAQLAEQSGAGKSEKKFRSAAPKGSKLAAGYTDRTLNRGEEDEDEKVQRVKALEESMKLGQIDPDTFEKLRYEIIGDDLKYAWLYRGLNKQLLERARRGEDIFNDARQEKGEAVVDVENELDKLEEQKVTPVVKEKTVKKGEMAPPSAKPSFTGKTRNEIMAELRAHREKAVAEKPVTKPKLGPGFHKLGAEKPHARIEIDENGREVQIVVDEEGNVKRRVRKVKPAMTGQGVGEEDDNEIKSLSAGAGLPGHTQNESDSDDDDIFEGVGTEYNPLEEPSDDSSSESEHEGEQRPSKQAKREIEQTTPSSTGTKASDTLFQPRNYFNEKSEPKNENDKESFNPLKDPNILAALRKTRTDDRQHEDSEEERRRKRLEELTGSNRDYEDLDMGFGASRYDDAEEAEESGKVKLAKWDGLAADDDDDSGAHAGQAGGNKRKRGPKKKKGDKNSVGDVMKILERRKGG